MKPTSGMPACRCRTRYRGHDSHVRHAGMPAPIKMKRHDFQVRHAGAGGDTEGMTPTSGMPACRRRSRFRRELLYQEDTAITSGMPACRTRFRGKAFKSGALATASGITAMKKRYLMLKKTIRQAGRQEGPRDERRHGRGHRYDGMSAKKKR